MHLSRICIGEWTANDLCKYLPEYILLTLLYGQAFMAILPARVIKQIVLFPIYVALFYGVSKIMGKAHLFTMVKGERA